MVEREAKDPKKKFKLISRKKNWPRHGKTKNEKDKIQTTV